ncbi:MAG: hypothetical protein OEW67_06885, partial [Cyclobacteriaceae bacterium]|nr:hypothetical protein [Cyclobacteriaceae bacterium]
KDWGLAGWAKPSIDIMMSGGADVAHHQLEQIYGTVDNPKQYLRINGNLKNTGIDPDMDCATHDNMQRLKEFGIKLFEENKKEIKEWLGL